MSLFLILIFQLFTAQAELRTPTNLPLFPPCAPESALLVPSMTDEPSRSFCEQWNPDFFFNGRKCCSAFPARGNRKKKLNRCAPQRAKNNYCGEMTPEQKEYSEAAASGKLGDLLSFLTEQLGRSGDQAYCTVNNGFLAHGRRIVPTEQNRIFIRSPGRCLNFATDAMAGMLEWLGREVAHQFPGENKSSVHLMIGDVAAPRGGCLFGRSGKRGHASHTSGQDADVGFIIPKIGHAASPTQFSGNLDPATNWWFLKKIFTNPFACVKVIFLDRRHINSLSKFAKNDEEWNTYHRFIRHVPSHKNHFHIRIGNGPGGPGCIPGFRPELEPEDDGETGDLDETSILEQLQPSQSSNVEEKKNE